MNDIANKIPVNFFVVQFGIKTYGEEKNPYPKGKFRNVSRKSFEFTCILFLESASLSQVNILRLL